MGFLRVWNHRGQALNCKVQGQACIGHVLAFEPQVVMIGGRRGGWDGRENPSCVGTLFNRESPVCTVTSERNGATAQVLEGNDAPCSVGALRQCLGSKN